MLGDLTYIELIIIGKHPSWKRNGKELFQQQEASFANLHFYLRWTSLIGTSTIINIDNIHPSSISLSIWCSLDIQVLKLIRCLHTIAPIESPQKGK